MLIRLCACSMLCLALAAPAAAQPRPSRADGSLDESAGLARGWTLLSQGSYPAALAQAQALLQVDPRSVGALALAVEAAIGTQGPVAGLDRYEQWLGSRVIEEPGVVRRIARAVLQEAAQRPSTRGEALQGLAGNGDARAAADLAALAGQGGAADIRAMARSGDEQSARALAAQLSRGTVDPVRTIEALGESGRAEAAAPILPYLSDQRPEIRGAAAEALGKLRGDSPETIGLLTPLLEDRSAWVRLRAAAALHRLGDATGTRWLQEFATSDLPGNRLLAAEAMASRPDAAWKTLVTELATAAGDAELRLRAAKLLAPHDPALAASVARALHGHDNIAIRELADAVMTESVGGEGLAVLRRQLRASDVHTRLRAAARVLELTR